MSDPIKTIGRQPEADAQRDAIHVAIMPVICGDFLSPGARVQFAPGSKDTVIAVPGAEYHENYLGVIDPFLGLVATKGARVWLFLKPGNSGNKLQPYPFVPLHGVAESRAMQKRKQPERPETAVAKLDAEGRTERGMFIKGMIEAANIHESSRYFFYLYPNLGPQRVRCVFPAEHRELVRNAFGKFVRVHGDFKYGWRDRNPYEIKVKEIEILPGRAEIPDVRAFFGIAPDATGGVDTEDFMEELRHG